MLRFTPLQLLLVVFITGCSGVRFQAPTAQGCAATNQTYGIGACRNAVNGGLDFDYSVQTGEVDLLFVDDNSGSMYSEQEKMANQFPGFLDSLSDFSYQIAITTTDVDSSAPGKDGRFLDFGGQTILKNDSRQRDSLHAANILKFQNTIKRAETLQCPSGPGCPSGDERGIYALNRALERPENSSFFRKGGHLAIVILSDEDERSSGGGAAGSEINGGALSSAYTAQHYDLPSTFVANSKAYLPANKSVSVHSIIIRPAINGAGADTACWQQQNSQGGGVKGFYGTQYALLSFPSQALQALGNIVTGTVGSICSSNFTQEMGNVAANIRAEQLQLPCTPDESSLKVNYSPAPSQATAFEVDASNRLNFQPGLPAGTRVNLKFNCPK
ncbi:MAG: hypothetical protein KF799_07410 [Bdellovibrionales bacterium]|nr:hypothetical protein [Bdellovibrionales bacterium]